VRGGINIFYYSIFINMAETILSPFEDEKFNKIYRFVLLVTICVFIYIFAITFIPISADAKDNVKTVLIFLLGYLSANGNYLTGGNPSLKKPDGNPTINAADNTSVNVNPVTPEK
jgi:hypothetical protein